jgi:hypothetical protein
MPFYQEVFGHLDLKLPFFYYNLNSQIPRKIQCYKVLVRGGADENDVLMKTLGISLHCYRAYMPTITLRGAIVAGVMLRQLAGKRNSFFPSNSVCSLTGISKKDTNISADNAVVLLTQIIVSRAIKDYVMGARPLGRP